jgi:ribosomal protein S18 acetylase RimI-like enzyme
MFHPAFTTHCHIRPLTLTDIQPLTQKCWHHRPPQEIEELRGRVQRLRQQGRGDGYVVVSADNVLGFGMLTLWTNRAEISDLVIAAAYRSQGFGTSLIQHLTTVTHHHNLPVLELGVLSDNHRAFRLYQRLGFNLARTITLQKGRNAQRILFLEKPILPLD